MQTVCGTILPEEKNGGLPAASVAIRGMKKFQSKNDVLLCAHAATIKMYGRHLHLNGHITDQSAKPNDGGER